MTHLGQSAPPDWPTDRCAECETTEGIHTPDVTKHPPLCSLCADLWYGAHAVDEGFDCRSYAQ